MGTAGPSAVQCLNQGLNVYLRVTREGDAIRQIPALTAFDLAVELLILKAGLKQDVLEACIGMVIEPFRGSPMAVSEESSEFRARQWVFSIRC